MEWGELALSPVGLEGDRDLAAREGAIESVLKDAIKDALDNGFDLRIEIVAGLKTTDVALECLKADLAKVVYGDLFMGLNSETLNTILKLVDPRDDSLKSRKTLKSSGEGLD